jgi:hypothetical protein
MAFYLPSGEPCRRHVPLNPLSNLRSPPRPALYVLAARLVMRQSARIAAAKWSACRPANSQLALPAGGHASPATVPSTDCECPAPVVFRSNCPFGERCGRLVQSSDDTTYPDYLGGFGPPDHFPVPKPHSCCETETGDLLQVSICCTLAYG